MPSPKKKLPTGPVHITPPQAQRAELSRAETTLNQETRKQDSSLDEVSIIEVTKNDSSLQESKMTEATLVDSITSPLSIDTGPSSVETEYKKVAMRMSLEAAEILQQFRATTGIPYEILVDVMVRNWDALPQRTKAAYLQQAKQLRVERLLAGQEKTLKTMKEKYLG